MDCIFCKIINGKIPSYTIYEDKNVKAFLDISPVANGHTLIIPKKHVENLYDADVELLKNVESASKVVGNLLKEKHLNKLLLKIQKIIKLIYHKCKLLIF